MRVKRLRNNRNLSIHLSLCAILLSSGTAVAQDVAPKQTTIEISMTPERVVLGEITEAHISVQTHTDAGPIDCESIRIHANTGDVSPLVSDGPGRYSCTYALPDDFYPRFALIAAVGTCGGVPVEGHTVIPLYGTGEVEVKSKPFSSVRLQIADEIFGPERTNAWGRVRIPIVVPPGHFYGVVGDRRIDLNLPPVNRVVAIADKTKIRAGDEGRTIVWIFAINQKGHPLVAGAIRASSPKGKTTPPQTVAPGVYRSLYTGPTRIGDQQDAITVAIDGDPTSVDTVRFSFVPGAPHDILLRPQVPLYQAGNDTPVVVEYAVVDQYGNPTGDEVTVGADFGQMSPSTPANHGAFVSTLNIPNYFEGRTSVRFTAEDTGNKGLKVTQELPLKAGAPVAIELKKASEPIPADGLTVRELPVQVLDEYNNPVRDITLTLSASAGHVPSSVVTDSVTTIPYTAPLGKQEGFSRIRVSFEDLSDTETVPLTDRTYLISATPRFGFITNFGKLTVPHWAIAADMNLWFLLRGLHFSVEFGHYFSKAELATEQLESTLHAFPLYMLIGYRLYPIPKLYIAANFGLGAQIIRNKSVRTGVWEHIEKATQLGIQGAIEAGYLVGPGKVVLRVGYIHAKSDKLELLTGYVGGLTVMGGYRIELW